MFVIFIFSLRKYNYLFNNNNRNALFSKKSDFFEKN